MMSEKIAFPMSRIATWIGTGLGSGYSPVAPGTAGSAVGAVLLFAFAGRDPRVLAVACVMLFFVAVWSAGSVARSLGTKDPGVVVIDEILGMWVSVVGLPLTARNVVIAFFLFRAFDVLKPPPCRALERISGGRGIVLDDVMAGVYANLVLRLASWAILAVSA